MFNVNWSLFGVEFGLMGLAFSVVILDILLKNHPDKGKHLPSFALLGVGLLLAVQISEWGRLGTAFNGAYVEDDLAHYFKVLFLLAGVLTLFMAGQYQSQLKRGHAEFSLLILLALIGMTMLVSAQDFLLFFVSLEILTVSSYIMTAYLTDKNASIEAGVKYLILGAVSTALFLYGLSFVYGSAVSTSFEGVRHALSLGVTPGFKFGMVLVLCALLFKIAAVPFHFWAPDVYEGAPTPVTGFLSIGSKVAGFAALLRLLSFPFLPAEAVWVPLFSVLAAITIFYGNLGAIPQTNIKRLLGYSSISHTGYLLIGLVTLSSLGKTAVLYYLAAYLVSAGCAFAIIVYLSRFFKTDEISEYAGLSRRSPLLAAGMLLSLLSLAGVPPLAGFFAKFYVLLAGVERGYLWLVFVGALNVITSLYYYLKVVKVIYLDKPSTDERLAVSMSQKLCVYILMSGILFLGIYQAPLLSIARQVFSNF